MAELYIREPLRPGPHLETRFSDDYLDTIQKLRVSFLQSRNRPVRNIEILSPSDYSPNKPIADQIVNTLEHANKVDQGIYATPECSVLKVVAIDPTDGGIRGESSHGVVFMQATVFENGKKELATIVCKPYLDAKQGLKELINTSLVLRIGKDTARPLAVVITGRECYYLSVFRPDIFTLDQQHWPKYPFSEAILERLQKIAYRVADYHSLGLAHHDLQMKNLSESPIGDIIGIDWESASCFAQEQLPDPGRIVDIATHDLEVLFSSMARSKDDHGVGALTKVSKESRWAVFDKIFFSHYLQRWIELVSEQSTDQADTDMIMESLATIEEEVRDWITKYTPRLH